MGLLAAIILGGTLLLGGLTAANAGWSKLIPGGGGFYSLWSAGRELLFRHGDPYGAMAAEQAQLLAYGRPARATENIYRLDLPFFLMPFYLPFGLIADPDLARGLWATLAQMALAAATLVSMRDIGWNPARSWFWACLLIGMLSYPVYQSLLEGSLAPLLLLTYVLILWALQSGRDQLAGALAVVALCKWEIGLPFMLLLGARVIQQRRWSAVAGFAMALTVLTSLSFLIFPSWGTPFLVAIIAVIRSGHGLSFQDAFRALLPAAPVWTRFLPIALVGAILVVEAARGRRASDRHFAWTAHTALAATPLLGLRSEPAYLVALLPALVILAAVGQRRAGWSRWISWGLLGLIGALPWPLLAGIRPPRIDADHILVMALPLAAFLGLYWTRWWFLRPPRTRLEQIRDAH